MQLKRSELYAAVWAKPVRQVASDIGVSDVAVGKACRKHKIPVPGRGYWARHQHGHRSRQRQLPPMPDGTDPIVTFKANPVPRLPANIQLSPEQEFERRPENRVAVPEALDRLHRIVRHTRAVLRKHRPDANGLLRATARDCLAVGVAPASLDRAARLLQGLAAACEIRSFAFEQTPSGIALNVNGEMLSLELSERTRRVPHQATEREEILQELNRGSYPPPHDWKPTGLLALRIKNAPGHPQHATWRDTSKQPLEERLNDVLAGIAEAARHLRERREAAERQRIQWEVEQEEREERERLARIERARFRFLETQALLWRRRQDVITYLDAVRARAKEADVTPDGRARCQDWLAWADGYLAERDPTTVLFGHSLLGETDRGFYH